MAYNNPYQTENFHNPSMGRDDLYLSLDMLDQYKTLYGDIMGGFDRATEFELPDYDKTYENIQRKKLKQEAVQFGTELSGTTAQYGSQKSKSLKQIGKSGIRSGSHVKGLEHLGAQFGEDIQGLREGFQERRSQTELDIAGIRSDFVDKTMDMYYSYITELDPEDKPDTFDMNNCLQSGGTWNSSAKRCD
jgi:hypothetical protein